jgi:hypothetical protein
VPRAARSCATGSHARRSLEDVWRIREACIAALGPGPRVVRSLSLDLAGGSA